MTHIERTQLQKDVLYESHMAHREESEHRARLGLIGEKLERLGLALQHRPELVTALPDPQTGYDYRSDLESLIERQALLDLCGEVRQLMQRFKAAETRKRAMNL